MSPVPRVHTDPVVFYDIHFFLGAGRVVSGLREYLAATFTSRRAAFQYFAVPKTTLLPYLVKEEVTRPRETA